MTRGAQGEQIAADFLIAHGYEILARNFHTRQGEIDLIVRGNGFLVFAEVKLRKNNRFGAPREAVTAVKQRKIIAAAEAWLVQHAPAEQPRFDVVEIYLPDSGCATIHHLENAFDA